jgi:nucleoside-diphosphate-sugar epimerase
MSMLVTGATGFLGEHVVPRLVARGATPACFVRESSDTALLRDLGVPLRYGDLRDAQSLTRALVGVRTLVNLANISSGVAPAIMEVCRRAEVERAVFISSTSIFTSLPARSRTRRLDAERRIEESGMEWTILRPTMIYGTERDRNMARLVTYLARRPVMPVIGSGQHLQQPVYVEDLADAVVQTIDSPQARGRAYNLSGKSPLTFNEVIDATARVLGKRITKLHFPVTPALLSLQLYERISPRPRLKSEQILRLAEDKAFPHEEAARDLHFRPRDFEEGIAAEVTRMRARGLV